jgi:hypothetical protein
MGPTSATPINISSFDAIAASVRAQSWDPAELENLEQSGESGFVKPAIWNRDRRLGQADDASRSEAAILRNEQLGGDSLAQ